MAQLYELTFKAEGEVRDKDGNLISSSEPFEGQTVITEEQAQQISAMLTERIRAAEEDREV